MTEKKRKYFNLTKEILSGKILSRQFFRKQAGLAGFIALLIFAYIYNGFIVNGQQARIRALREEIKEARYEMLELSSQHTQMTRSSAINAELKRRNSKVEESVVPPIQVK